MNRSISFIPLLFIDFLPYEAILAFCNKMCGFNHCIFCLLSDFVLNEILLLQFGSHVSACLSHVSDIKLKVKHLSLSRSLGGWGEVLDRERGEKPKNEEENKGIDASEGGRTEGESDRERGSVSLPQLT